MTFVYSEQSINKLEVFIELFLIQDRSRSFKSSQASSFHWFSLNLGEWDHYSVPVKRLSEKITEIQAQIRSIEKYFGGGYQEADIFKYWSSISFNLIPHKNGYEVPWKFVCHQKKEDKKIDSCYQWCDLGNWKNNNSNSQVVDDWYEGGTLSICSFDN